LLARPSLTTGAADYWTSFFPPLLLLGAGLGMSAAPLSTTIMNSVSAKHFGIASGINSTLSRLSSVLGIAAMGPIAITTFRHSLMRYANALSLDDRWSRAWQREAWRFADAVPPPGMSPEMSNAFQNGVRLAYVDAFRLLSCIAAAVVVLSTLLAALMLRKPTVGN